MNAEQVIQAGKAMWWVNGWVFFALILASAVLWFLFSIVSSDTEWGPQLTVFSSLAAASLVFVFFYGYLYFFEKPSKIEAWKSETASPFVASLPKKEAPIDALKIGPEKAGSPGTYRVSYRLAGSDEERAAWAFLKVAETENSAPSASFRQLDKKLGEGFEKGQYDLEIRVPSLRLEWIGGSAASEAVSDSEAGRVLLGMLTVIYSIGILVGASAVSSNVRDMIQRARREREYQASLARVADSVAEEEDAWEEDDNEEEEIGEQRFEEDEIEEERNEARAFRIIRS